MSKQTNTVVWEHGTLEVEADLSADPVVGFKLLDSNLEYVFESAVKSEDGKKSMHDEESFLSLKRLKGALDAIDVPKLKGSSELAARLESVIKSFQMRVGEDLITTNDQVKRVATELDYQGVCRIPIPGESNASGFAMYSHVKKNGPGVVRPVQKGAVSQTERIISFRKDAIRIVLNKTEAFAKEYTKGIEDNLVGHTTPENVLEVWCEVFRTNRQQKVLRDSVLSRLTAEERSLFQEHMTLDNFLSRLKFIATTKASSDFDSTMVPLVGGKSIEVPRISPSLERYAILDKILNTAIKVNDTFERYFNLYDDRTLVAFYQYATMNTIKKALRVVTENIPGLMDSKVQDIITEKGFFDSIDSIDRRLLFYKSLQLLTPRLYEEVRKYDEDKREVREELNNRTSHMNLRQVNPVYS